MIKTFTIAVLAAIASAIKINEVFPLNEYATADETQIFAETEFWFPELILTENENKTSILAEAGPVLIRGC